MGKSFSTGLPDFSDKKLSARVRAGSQGNHKGGAMIKKSKSGLVTLITWRTGPPTLRVRQNDPFARARHVPGWRPFYVARHPGFVVHAYRPD